MAIAFDLGTRAPARLTIYDAAGRRVRRVVDRTLDAGHHDASWDGRDDRGVLTAPGIYFYRLETRGLTASRQLVRVR